VAGRFYPAKSVGMKDASPEAYDSALEAGRKISNKRNSYGDAPRDYFKDTCPDVDAESEFKEWAKCCHFRPDHVKRTFYKLR
jgi:hypothetical protein